ncbi:MAG: STAS domain-containing protein [Gammaproteobacteria bacterium]|nr:STAS domain-containing protein [Gammaproteobacteria bacterium]
MAIINQVSDNGKEVTISISGRFDFQLYDDFRNAYSSTAGEGVKYVVDMSGTEYLDSSALGMLLLLREHAGGNSANVSIENTREEVKKILAVANFEKLFSL